MNKFKKVGLTALAGSLAAISANAAEMSVSGGVNMTYVNQTGVTGNPYGMESRLTFGTSGELENGMGVSYYTTLETHNAGTGQYSGELALDMGDLGRIALQQGVGNAGIDAIDDMSVKAYEEVWDGLTSAGSLTNTGGTTAFKYTNSFAGVDLNVAARKGSSTANAEGEVSGDGEASGYSFAVMASGDTLGVDGLKAGFGYGQVEEGQLNNAVANSDDKTFASVYATYAMGPVSVSAQRNQVNAQSKNVEGDYYAIAFNVNENFAISYGEISNSHNSASTVAVVDEDVDGVGFSYTMGGMTLAGQQNSADNANGVAGAKDDHTELRLSFSF